MSVWAIVAAAGEGRRFGGPKAFSVLARVPMVAHSLAAIASVGQVRSIVLVVAPEAVDDAPALLAASMPATPVIIVPGGHTRQASVRAGLDHVPKDANRVLVHDAARPLVTPGLVAAVLAALDHAPGAVAAVPERDTLKRVDDGRVVATVERDGLWRAQTPQAFRAEVLRRAHAVALAEGFEATDDAMLLEWIHEPVAIVPGDERNLKVTAPEDLAVAEAILEAARHEA